MKIVLLLLGSLFFVAAAVAEDTVGQYQLFSGVVESTGKGGLVQEHTVFRIDTKTGMTWTYVLGERGGKMVEFWSQIPENPESPKLKKP